MFKKFIILILVFTAFVGCSKKKEKPRINPVPETYDNISNWNEINGIYIVEMWSNYESTWTPFKVIDEGDEVNEYYLINNGVKDLSQNTHLLFSDYNTTYPMEFHVRTWLNPDISTGTLRRIESWDLANSSYTVYGIDSVDCSNYAKLDSGYSVGVGYEYKFSKSDNCLYKITEDFSGERKDYAPDKSIIRLRKIESLPIGPCNLNNI